MKMFRKDEGFTLVELMVVVLIIGILVAIAVPVFLNASKNAQAKSCQANQRTILGAMTTAYANQAIEKDIATAVQLAGATGPSLDSTLTGSGGYLKAAPKCPIDQTFYSAKMTDGAPSVTADGYIGTNPAAVNGFYPGHVLP